MYPYKTALRYSYFFKRVEMLYYLQIKFPKIVLEVEEKYQETSDKDGYGS